MRPRSVLIALALLALPVGFGLLLSGRSRAPAPPSQHPTQIGLNLQAGVGDARLVACGSTHHYTLYRAGSTIHFVGPVYLPPPGSWKVLVKLKSCTGGTWQPAGSVSTRARHGRFKGSFVSPVPGLYFARAQLNSAGVRITRSYKQFFRVE